MTAIRYRAVGKSDKKKEKKWQWSKATKFMRRINETGSYKENNKIDFVEKNVKEISGGGKKKNKKK